MSKRLARVVLGLVAAGLAVASLWSLTGTVDIARAEDKQGGYQDSCMVVMGDSTSYTVCDFVLPAAFDTSETFDVRSYDVIAVRGIGSGDSLAYWIDYNLDDSYWTNLVDSTFVNSTEESTFPPTSSTQRILFNNQLIHDQVIGTAHGPTYRNWLISNLRVRVQNIDVSDTLINLRYRVIGRSK